MDDDVVIAAPSEGEAGKNIPGLFPVAGKEVAGQGLGAGSHQAQSVLQLMIRNHRQHRPEDLLLHDRAF